MVLLPEDTAEAWATHTHTHIHTVTPAPTQSHHPCCTYACPLSSGLLTIAIHMLLFS